MNDKTKICFHIKNAIKSDGPAVYEIARSCSSLDLNSRYCYLLLCTHFNKFCLIAKAGKKTVGFVSAYPHPHYADTLFIWQIGIAPDFHNLGIGTNLLKHLILLGVENGLSYIETTITPSNKASRALFQKMTEAYNTNFEESDCFSSSLLGDGHEEERLLRIGPLEMKGDIKK
jgi:L-2,4-diaminobutyric acid acetyltransferase